VKVAVEPSGELGAVSAHLEELPPNLGFDLAGVVLDDPKDAQHQREGPRRAEVAVIGLALVQLLVEVGDNRPVDVSVGIIQGGGNVLQLVEVDRRQAVTGNPVRKRHAAARRNDGAVSGRAMVPGHAQVVEETAEAIGSRGIGVDWQQDRMAIDNDWQRQNPRRGLPRQRADRRVIRQAEP
jgi:hypothetical protein